MGAVIGLLHERLPELRKLRDLSQNDLADLTPGVSLDTVRKYELRSRAGTIPEVEILEALAGALGMDPAEAFYEYPIAAARRAARPGVTQRKGTTATPEAGRRRAADATRKAAQRRSEPQPKPREGPGEKPRRGRAA
jgi:transcriptional regulator with XRE-family HTH domain